MLMEASVQHRFVCKALKDGKPKAKGSRNGATKKPRAGRRPDLSEEDQQMADSLKGLGWNAEKVEYLLPHAKGDTFEARFRAVMAYADSEGGA